ncbi:hypothetical protein MUP01_04600 [Candidatus Bathyarchaeota archaeon]|nr:hypothetical protein [Candidatus Bathyarchaeota archaeon]
MVKIEKKSFGIGRDRTFFGILFDSKRAERALSILKKTITEADAIIESRITQIPRRIITLLIRKYVTQDLTFPAQRPEFYEFCDPWPKKLVADSQVWPFCDRFFDTLRVMGLCAKTYSYVSTRRGELRELRYVISPLHAR